MHRSSDFPGSTAHALERHVLLGRAQPGGTGFGPHEIEEELRQLSSPNEWLITGTLTSRGSCMGTPATGAWLFQVQQSRPAQNAENAEIRKTLEKRPSDLCPRLLQQIAENAKIRDGLLHALPAVDGNACTA
jgi:hypothetical protein